MIYAPVLITTMNRYECLKRCIKSLQRNSWADQTELFISVDYPPTEKYVEEYKKVRSYLENKIDGFKKVNVLFHDENLGAINNAEWLRKLVCAKCNRYIFIEDDNELAPSFLEFCDKGLELFENDDSVFALNASDYVWCGNGYVPPVRRVHNNENNIEKRQMVFHAVAYWENKRTKSAQFCGRLEKNDGLLSWNDIKKLHQKSTSLFYQYLAMVLFQREKLPWYKNKLYTIDFMHDLYMVLKDKYVICPIEPLQRDFGVDGNGVNYKEVFKNATELKEREWSTDLHFEFRMKNQIKINNTEIELHDRNSNISALSKAKMLFKYVKRIAHNL